MTSDKIHERMSARTWYTMLEDFAQERKHEEGNKSHRQAGAKSGNRVVRTMQDDVEPNGKGGGAVMQPCQKDTMIRAIIHGPRSSNAPLQSSSGS